MHRFEEVHTHTTGTPVQRPRTVRGAAVREGTVMIDNRLTANNVLVWRVAAWCGPVFIVGLLVFWGLIAGYIPAPPQDWSPEQIAAHYTENNTAIKIGMVGTLFFAPFYFVWTALASRLIGRMEGPNGILSNIELVGGALGAIITQLFATCWLAGAFRIEDRTAQEVQLLHDLGWMIFDMAFFTPAVQIISFGVAIILDARQRPLFPRWVGWASCGLALTYTCVVLMPFVSTGPFAWNGLLSYWFALGGFFVWAALAMYYAFGAINRVVEEERGTDGARPATGTADTLARTTTTAAG